MVPSALAWVGARWVRENKGTRESACVTACAGYVFWGAKARPEIAHLHVNVRRGVLAGVLVCENADRGLRAGVCQCVQGMYTRTRASYVGAKAGASAANQNSLGMLLRAR